MTKKPPHNLMISNWFFFQSLLQKSLNLIYSWYEVICNAISVTNELERRVTPVLVGTKLFSKRMKLLQFYLNYYYVA